MSPESTKTIFGEIHTSIDTLAFTFGNVWVLCLCDFSTQVSTAVFCCSEEKLSWFGLTCNPFSFPEYVWLNYVGQHTLSWITASTKSSVLSIQIWHLDIWLQSFWLPYGRCGQRLRVGDPPGQEKQGELVSLNAALSNTAVFKRVNFKHGITPPPHKKKTLRRLLFVLNWGSKAPTASDV